MVTEGLSTKWAVDGASPYHTLLSFATIVGTGVPDGPYIFGRFVNRPYGLCFNFAFCILHFAFFITQSPSVCFAASSLPEGAFGNKNKKDSLLMKKVP